MKILNYVLSAFLIVYMIGSLFLIVEQNKAIVDLQMQQQFEHANNYQVMNDLRRVNHSLDRELGEFQDWRAHITAVTRMGWNQANRYIREFPLQHRYFVDDGS